jgi:hypothetical protein
MKKGDYVYTPRFCKVMISEVYESSDKACSDGFTEPTHYDDEHWHIRGKSTGINRMIFAAIKKTV